MSSTNLFVRHNLHLLTDFSVTNYKPAQLSTTFFGHNFWANRAENFYGNSGDYYLSIGGKSKLLYLLLIFLIFGPLLAGKQAWPPCSHLMACGLRTQRKCWHTVESVFQTSIIMHYVTLLKFLTISYLYFLDFAVHELQNLPYIQNQCKCNI